MNCDVCGKPVPHQLDPKVMADLTMEKLMATRVTEDRSGNVRVLFDVELINEVLMEAGIRPSDGGCLRSQKEESADG